jgi:hypothetical protein
MKLTKKQQIAYLIEQAKFAYKHASEGNRTEYYKGQLIALEMALLAVSGVRNNEISEMVTAITIPFTD